MIANRKQDRHSALARLACCPSSPDPEWQAAAVKFFQLHRREGTTPASSGDDDALERVETAFIWRQRWGNRAPAPAPKNKKPMNPWRPTAEEGNTKYPGWTITDIILRDSAYGVWLNEQAGERQTAARKRGKL